MYTRRQPNCGNDKWRVRGRGTTYASTPDFKVVQACVIVSRALRSWKFRKALIQDGGGIGAQALVVVLDVKMTTITEHEHSVFITSKSILVGM